MRVFVLGVDGLDYYLALKWNLKWLLQKKNGLIWIDKEYYHDKSNEPYTPKIWASIITGKRPSEHGIKYLQVWGKNLEKIRWLPVIRHIKGKRRLLSMFGIKPRVPDKRDLKFNTLFDIIKPSVAVNVICYNDKNEYHVRLRRAIKKGTKEYIREAWTVHKLRVADTFEALERHEKWKLFMTYFNLLDIIGHVCISKCNIELRKAYLEMNNLSRKLHELVDSGDTLFLIISDHGMIPSEDGTTGKHSNYAFWSINREYEWKPKDFTDFFYKIQEWVK